MNVFGFGLPMGLQSSGEVLGKTDVQLRTKSSRETDGIKLHGHPPSKAGAMASIPFEHSVFLSI
jgi:hypothetical protein